MKKSIVPSGRSFFSSFFDGQATDWNHLVKGFLLSDFCIPSSATADDWREVDSNFCSLSFFLPKFNPIEISLLCRLAPNKGKLFWKLKLFLTALFPWYIGTARGGANADACDVIAAKSSTLWTAEELLMMMLWERGLVVELQGVLMFRSISRLQLPWCSSRGCYRGAEVSERLYSSQWVSREVEKDWLCPSVSNVLTSTKSTVK